MTTYTTTVGIEVHAELKTKSKMFCGCKNEPHASEANTHICPVCMAHPGSLPVVNKEAVHFLMQVGRAIGGTLAEFSEFDRKNYFYPDIPKAYQISQYKFPFVEGGELGGVAITRIHLEEDTARSVHDQGEESLLDFNRAGVPLMELVTEPVIHSAKQGGDFTRELQLLLRTLGVSDANMEKGEMRVEANISVSSTDSLGTKVEVKNLNSFKSMELAIDFETKRHIALIESGGEVKQETLGWDENKGKTFVQRSKETAHDYRYFPDPDIPKFKRSEIPEFSNSRIDEILPETPANKRQKLASFGLDEKQIEIIISDIERSTFFDKTYSVLPSAVSAKLLANYLTSDVISIVDADTLTLDKADPSLFAKLLELVATNKLTSRVAKDLLKEVIFEGNDPYELAESRSLLQEDNEDALIKIIEEVVTQNPSVVSEYKAGKEASIQFLVGQGMKASKGSANPTMLLELFKKVLGSN
jgi:aspartyl-tRNA(Asn)/glutamyl-tRNA(Gln) amidotransferase subunit B